MRRGIGQDRYALMRLAGRIRAHLRRGGVIAYPTASCYGLGCDPANPRAVKRLLAIKARPQSKGVILIGSREAHLQPYLGPVADEIWQRARALWPGPYTWVLPASRRAHHDLRGRHRTVAVRVDAHPEAALVCRILDQAIVSTSANLSGRRSLKRYRDCLRQFGRRVLVLPGRIGTSRHPSHIYDGQTGKRLR